MKNFPPRVHKKVKMDVGEKVKVDIGGKSHFLEGQTRW